MMRKQVIFATLANLVPVGFSLLILLYLIHFGTKSDIGIWGLLQAVSLPIHLFFTFKLRVIQLVDHKNEYSDNSYFYSRVLLGLLNLIVTIFYALLFMKDIYFYSMLALACSYSLAIIREFYISRYQIENKNHFFFIVNSLSGLLSFAFFIYTYKISSSIYYSIIVFSLTRVSFITLDYILFKNKIYLIIQDINKIEIYKLLRLGLPLGVTVFLTALLVSIPQIMIERKLGVEKLGAFVSIAVLFSVFGLVFNSAFQVFLPNLSKGRKEDQRLEVKKIFSYLLLFLFLFDLIILYFVDGIYYMLLKDSSLTYIKEFVLCLLAANTLVVFSFGNFLLNLSKQYVLQPYLYFFLVLIITVFNLLFLEILEISSVFLSLIIANLIGFITSVFVYYKRSIL